MISTRCIGHSVLATCFPLTAAQAEINTLSASEKSGATLIKEVVVTATRYEEEIETVPANVSVITAGDIAQSTAKDVPGILQKEVGLHVYDITGNRRSYRVDRSGFGETAALNTLVLVDGRRLNNPDLSGADWMLIPLDRIERIEVIRGSRGSVLYGDNATDSVINILTKGGGEQTEASVKGAGGSYSTLSTSANVRGMYKDLSYALSASYYETEGYRDNSDTDSRDIGLNLDYSLGDRVTVGLSGGYRDDDTGLPGALRLSALEAGIDRRDSLNPFDFVDTEDYYVQLNPEIDVFDSSYFKMPFSYRKRDQNFFATFVGGEFRGGTEIDYLTASPQLVAKGPLGRFKNNLTLGFDWNYSHEEITNESLFFGDRDVGKFDLRKKNYGIYAHDEIYPTDKLALSAGYRYDRVKYEFSPKEPNTPGDTDFDKNLFTAGFNYRFYEDSYFYVSYAEGFRYPVLDELFSFFTTTVNRDLGPQTSDNYEVGIRYYLARKLYANVSIFRLDTKDEIFFNPVNFANENLNAKTRRDGIELSLGFESQRISLSGNYTYRDNEIRGGRYSGKQVPNVPRHQATLEVLWRPLEQLTFALNGTYIGKRFLESDFANAFPKQDDYTLLNLKLKYNWRKFTAFLDVNNLLDEDYAAYGVLSTFPVEPAFYPSPERNFLAGISFDYKL